MIIIHISQRAWRLIKPRQIINYDAGIVLIDSHFQLNVKTTLDNTNQRHLEYGGNLMSTKNRTRRNNNPQHPLS